MVGKVDEGRFSNSWEPYEKGPCLTAVRGTPVGTTFLVDGSKKPLIVCPGLESMCQTEV